MICSSWLYCYMKFCHRCFYVFCILFWLTIFNLVTTTQSQHQLFPQGNGNAIVNSDFCNENRKSLFKDSFNKLETLSPLSSKYGPSSPLNYNSPSSRNISLPQESLNNATYTPHLRFDSDALDICYPMAGCISLLNYYWRYNSSVAVDHESLLGVQIFLFHLNNSKKAYVNFNLRILLHPTQDTTLLRPVAIVLSSSLPRKFYLSVLSYLSRTQHPIHIILTNFSSDVVIIDPNLTDSDMARIFISVLDSSYNDVLQYSAHLSHNANLVVIRDKFIETNLYKYGHFSGYRYTSISGNKSRELLWLYDNGNRYSTRRPNIKLVAIYLVHEKANIIDVVLGKPEGPRNSQNDSVFYQEECILVQDDNYEALDDRIWTNKKTFFSVNEDRTCTYRIHSSASSSSSSTQNKAYKTITWLHFERFSEKFIHLELTSDRLYKKDETHLVILTAENVKLSTIYIDQFFLHKGLQILTNISLDQFDPFSQQSSFLVSIETMNPNTTDEVSQQQITSKYITASKSAIMQTTTYKLELNKKKYYIRINVDDSRIYSYDRVLTNTICVCNSNTQLYMSMSIDLRIWKLINSWTPTEFRFESMSHAFVKINNTFATFKLYKNDCSLRQESMFFRNNIYGIWHNNKYLLYLPYKHKCRKKTNKPEPELAVTTESYSQGFIDVSEHGFNVYNDSTFKSYLKTPLHNGDRLFIKLTPDVIGPVSRINGIQLRDCYITNHRASTLELNNSTESVRSFRKMIIVQDGCINKSSTHYSNTKEFLRPTQHSAVNFFVYTFSVGIDATKWAVELSLGEQWQYRGRMEVHLYCGINKCNLDKSSITNPSASIGQCVLTQECSRHFASEQTYMYFGSLLIIREFNMPLKISVLVFLSVSVSIFLCFFIIFLWRLYKFRSRYKYNDSIVTDHWRSVSCHDLSPPIGTTKLKSKLDYHRLQLMHGAHTSMMRRYSDGNIQSLSPVCSLQQLIVDNDKSIILQAGYLSCAASVGQVDDKLTATVRHRRSLLSHSIPEFGRISESGQDRVLYSWPMSSVERHGRVCHSQPTSSSSSRHEQQQHSHQPKRDFRLSKARAMLRRQMKASHFTFHSKPKSLYYSSNQKSSSNRTTVSGGESASASDNKPSATAVMMKSFKWWSPKSNFSLNKNVVMSRN